MTVDAWANIFEFGYDEHMEAHRTITGPHGFLRVARQAWNKHGAKWFLASRKPDKYRPLWALVKFGKPNNTKGSPGGRHRNKYPHAD